MANAKKKQHVRGLFTAKHIEVKNGQDDGACFTGHVSSYKRSSCSYRWQAHEESKNTRRATSFTPVTGAVGTSAYKTKRKVLFPRKYKTLPAPQPGDWDIDGPNRKDMRDAVGRRIGEHANFHKNWLWPYWHNSHHLIPKGTFNET